MTLRMVDGPVANLPAGFDAYAGYVNDSGIGETWPAVVKKFGGAGAELLSITTDGSPAMCADVERGAMTNWSGYHVGYCEVSSVNSLIASYGRPSKLWTAHRDPRLGRHICSPACWPGLVTTADGTQWTNHGGAYDESLLLSDFFDFLIPPPKEEPVLAISSDGRTVVATRTDGHLIVSTVGPSGTFNDAGMVDLSDHGQAVNPAGGPWTFSQ